MSRHLHPIEALILAALALLWHLVHHGWCGRGRAPLMVVSVRSFISFNALTVKMPYPSRTRPVRQGVNVTIS